MYVYGVNDTVPVSFIAVGAGAMVYVILPNRVGAFVMPSV
jgi:hypothetical protein